MIFPAAQPTTPVPAATPVLSGPPVAPRFTADGRIAGIDGVLDQIAGAVTRQVVPVLQNTVLPILQRDKDLQRTIGEGIGRGAVQALRPILWVMAGSLVVIAYAYWRSTTQPKPPRDNPRPLRSARRTSIQGRGV